LESLVADGVIDTCCLINLLAVGELRDWLPVLGLRWHVPSAVMGEALFLRATDEAGKQVKEAVDLRPLVADGVLSVCDLVSTEELALYVRLAAELDDGEAMALALAKCRKWLLATDDRKGRRLAAELAVPVLTTPELMKRWADAASPTPDELAGALRRIQEFARFVPSDDFPLHDWWLRNAHPQP
jgi:predicted nucleic acid-binding protein